MGTITDVDGEPLRGAIVQLEDLRSLQVQSYISQTGGKYHFYGLYTEADYQLRVQYRGKFSRAKFVRRFNSHKNVTVDFRITVE